MGRLLSEEYSAALPCTVLYDKGHLNYLIEAKL